MARQLAPPTRGNTPDAIGAIAEVVATALRESPPGAIGVACSGGVDSMALAHAVVRASHATQLVVIVHVDHQLQPTSGAAATLVETWARSNGAVPDIRRVNVVRRGSVEADARDARYEAFAAAVAEHKIATLLTAHTLTDQAETVLERIVRGTGPAGLRGIPPRRGPYARPFLATSRAATEAYVAHYKLPVWHDPMNDDAAVLRVRLRQEIMPALRAINPRVDDALVRLATSANEWTDVFDATIAKTTGLTGPAISAKALLSAAPGVAKHAIASAAGQVGVALEAVHFDAVLALAQPPTAGTQTIDVPGGTVVRAYDQIRVAATSTIPKAGAAPSVLEVEGPDGPYKVRGWRTGDRMRPRRLRGGSKSLAELLIDAKIPRDARPLIRVVTAADGTIVWADHIGPAWQREIEVEEIPAP